MWWQIVFWILLLPLIVSEIVIFVKTKRLFWLVFALSIFVYVIAVCYTLDVFSASRNAVIVTLLASSGLMAFIGKYLGKAVKKQKKISTPVLWITIALAGALTLLFIVSAIFGRGMESVSVASSVERDAIIRVSDEKIPQPLGSQSVGFIKRTIQNDFFLPVPVRQDVQFRACLVTNIGVQELFAEGGYEQYPEVAPHEVREIDMMFSPAYMTKEQAAKVETAQILIYHRDGGGYEYEPCEQIQTSPEWTIPVTQ